MWKRRRSETALPVDRDKLLRRVVDQFSIWFDTLVGQLALPILCVVLTSDDLRHPLDEQLLSLQQQKFNFVEITILVVWTAVFGLGFYIMKCRSQMIYGFNQIIVALSFTYAGFIAATNNGNMSPFYILALGEFGAVYLLVCGLDNIYRSTEGTAKKRWESVFYGYELMT